MKAMLSTLSALCIAAGTAIVSGADTPATEKAEVETATLEGLRTEFEDNLPSFLDELPRHVISHLHA